MDSVVVFLFFLLVHVCIFKSYIRIATCIDFCIRRWIELADILLPSFNHPYVILDGCREVPFTNACMIQGEAGMCIVLIR